MSSARIEEGFSLRPQLESFPDQRKSNGLAKIRVNVLFVGSPMRAKCEKRGHHPKVIVASDGLSVPFCGYQYPERVRRPVSPPLHPVDEPLACL